MDLKKKKTGNFVLDGIMGVLAKWLDKTDADEKLEAAFKKINGSVDFKQVAAILAASPAVHDKAAFKEAIIILGEVLEKLPSDPPAKAK